MPDLSGTDAGVIGGRTWICLDMRFICSGTFFFCALLFSVSESKQLTVLIPLNSRIDFILSKQIISSVVIFWTKLAHLKRDNVPY